MPMETGKAVANPAMSMPATKRRFARLKMAPPSSVETKLEGSAARTQRQHTGDTNHQVHKPSAARSAHPTHFASVTPNNEVRTHVAAYKVSLRPNCTGPGLITGALKEPNPAGEAKSGVPRLLVLF